MKALALLAASLLLGGIAGSGLALLQLGDLSAAAIPVPTPPPSMQVKSAPAVRVDREVHDFGRQTAGETGEHEFIFRNVGTEPLALTAGEDRSCACTNVEVPVETIPPGGEAVVRVEWQVKARPEQLFREYATVLTNDPARPRVPLVISGEVVEQLVISPSEVVLRGFPGRTLAQTVQLLAYETPRLKVDVFVAPDDSDDSPVDVSLAPIPPEQVAEAGARSGFALEIKAKSTLSPGRFRHTIRLRTNVPERPKATIEVVGEILTPVTVSGSAWNAAAGELQIAPGESRSLLVQLRGAAGAKLAVEQVLPAGLEVQIGKPNGDPEQTLLVPLRIHAPLEADLSQGGQIVLTTGHPEQPKLTLKLK